jgi:hypothetical protein
MAHTIIPSARRASTQLSEVPPSHPGHRGFNEIDYSADTICAGPNWRLLELSGAYCTVSPFSADYQPKTNVPIAKCATMYTYSSNGNSVVLVADQVLWFGNDLHCLLINPHQIRSHGYSVCNDPWDPHRPLGIDPESTFIPLLASGPNLLFESHVPTDWEMVTLLIMEITASVWNPADLHMSRPLSTLTSVVNCTSTASRDVWSDLAAHLSAISPPLACRNVSSLYVGQIHFQDAPTGTNCAESAGIGAAFTSERHSSVKFENLSRKWNIGLETAKRTLQVTTQQGIWTAVHPSHRQYQVNQLHLNRQRLNRDWFTDTLFSKVASIRGNTCAHIFTNSNFTTVHPLNLKRVSQVLIKFTDDIGIADTLLSDGAAEDTGQHTDFMKKSTD